VPENKTCVPENIDRSDTKLTNYEMTSFRHTKSPYVGVIRDITANVLHTVTISATSYCNF